MRPRLPRQASGSCSRGKAFYRCNKGPYTGCCSTDPCDTGVCGDDISSNPAATATSKNPTTTARTSPGTSKASKSSPATGSIWASTSAASLPAAGTGQPATSTPTSDTSPSTIQPNQPAHSPVGVAVGGVVGGLALLALLGALLWYCLRRKAKLRISIGREKKKKQDQKEKEFVEAARAVLDREKMLDAARQKSAPKVKSEDPSAEFGVQEAGITGNAISALPRIRQSHKHKSHRPTSPNITPTPGSALGPSSSQQHSMLLSSASEKENVESIPILDGAELTSVNIPVIANATSLNQHGADPDGAALPPPLSPVEFQGISKSRRINGSTRISGTRCTEFSSVSPAMNSYISIVSPVSPIQPLEVIAQDGVVMRSNLNGSWNWMARPGSVRKHVMSFMEYETENDSVCGSSRWSSLRIPGKAVLPGDEGWGLDHQDSSLRR